MATEYGLYCKTCDCSQDDFWKVEEQIITIWENRFIIKHLQMFLFDLQSNNYYENVTISFAVEHCSHEVILKNEYGKYFSLQFDMALIETKL